MAASQSNAPTASTNESNKPAARSTPKDALVMSSILREMGISDYEPRVVNQMLEFTYRYITTVLDDAKVYSTHAGKKEIDSDDVQLAIQSRLDHSYTNPPPRDFLIEIARQKNRVPLPQIQPKSGLRLPPDRYCLTGKNYKVRAQNKPSIRPSTIIGRTNSISSSVGSTLIKPVTVAHIVRPPSTSVPIVTPTSISVPHPLSSVNKPVLSNQVPQVKKELGTVHPVTTGHVASAATLQVKTVVQRPTTNPNPAATSASKTPKGNQSGNPASIMTVSALPSMDETVASAQQPLITPQKRKLDDDDDYDA